MFDPFHLLETTPHAKTKLGSALPSLHPILCFLFSFSKCVFIVTIRWSFVQTRFSIYLRMLGFKYGARMQRDDDGDVCLIDSINTGRQSRDCFDWVIYLRKGVGERERLAYACWQLTRARSPVQRSSLGWAFSQPGSCWRAAVNSAFVERRERIE